MLSDDFLVCHTVDVPNDIDIDRETSRSPYLVNPLPDLSTRLPSNSNAQRSSVEVESKSLIQSHEEQLQLLVRSQRKYVKIQELDEEIDTVLGNLMRDEDILVQSDGELVVPQWLLSIIWQLDSLPAKLSLAQRAKDILTSRTFSDDLYSPEKEVLSLQMETDIAQFTGAKYFEVPDANFLVQPVSDPVGLDEVLVYERIGAQESASTPSDSVVEISKVFWQ